MSNSSWNNSFYHKFPGKKQALEFDQTLITVTGYAEMKMQKVMLFMWVETFL